MKIIDAVWEKRNLGVTCAEIEIDKDDSEEQIVDALRNRNEQYIVVKVTPDNRNAIFAVQNEGFVYIESLIEIEADLRKGPFIPDKCKHLIKNAGYHIASKEEINRALEEVREGDIFATDRISVDPYFSREKAGQRYAYWIEDVLSGGNSDMIVTEYLGENIGFFVLQHKPNYSSSILNALYRDYLGSGLGFVNSYCSQKYLFEKGVKRSVSHISTNNWNIMKLARLFNNSFNEIKYVFVKHDR